MIFPNENKQTDFSTPTFSAIGVEKVSLHACRRLAFYSLFKESRAYLSFKKASTVLSKRIWSIHTFRGYRERRTEEGDVVFRYDRYDDYDRTRRS